MSMVTIEIRDVPQDTYDLLVAGAAARGLTLQEYLLSLLEEAAADGGYGGVAVTG
ncbi:hypothetical protein [Glycomyces artemisiae]|uniref:HicB-like protein involved in pilus formation n=1 Tax=Glycomyces artemisiae TaxID=1076443 RepID=A0A2T0UV18_9ACTN|nr:hypothetical protein [Glycomyces artemisiae]PRY61775.1 hypothetical protein B0I28_10198 [Glycomyces artemisiae]